jgi:hypothetical protein
LVTAPLEVKRIKLPAVPKVGAWAKRKFEKVKEIAIVRKGKSLFFIVGDLKRENSRHKVATLLSLSVTHFTKYVTHFTHFQGWHAAFASVAGNRKEKGL